MLKDIRSKSMKLWQYSDAFDFKDMQAIEKLVAKGMNRLK